MLFVGVGFVLFRDQFHYLAPFSDLLEGSAGRVHAGIVDGTAEEDGEGLVEGLGTGSRPGFREWLAPEPYRKAGRKSDSGLRVVGRKLARLGLPDRQE